MRGMLVLIMVSGLLACAGQSPNSAPSAPPAQISAMTTPVQQNAAFPAAAAAPTAPVDPNLANLIKEAKAKGYKMVNQDGKVLYCRTDLKTGSHLVKETTCLDQDELQTLHERTAEGLEIMQHQQHPPSSN
jgi:hypothetical protein